MKETRKTQGENYISTFPKFKKWINQCSCCQKKGYNPALPNKITTEEGSMEVYFIKKYFLPLSIDEAGLCEQCREILNKRK